MVYLAQEEYFIQQKSSRPQQLYWHIQGAKVYQTKFIDIGVLTWDLYVMQLREALIVDEVH